MAASEKDEVPMLSNLYSEVDEHEEFRNRRFSSRNRSASMSISMNSQETYDNESYMGHTGPLRTARRTPFMQMSGPLYISRKHERPTQGAIRPKTSELTVEKYPSSKGMGQHDWPDNYAGKNEHLLRSGQLGICNDPYCTTCPTYYKLNWQRKTSKSSIIFDSKFHNALYGDAKGWARRILSFLQQYVIGVMNPHAKVVQRWNKFFAISCLAAIFLDPLFFFLLSVQQDNKCIVINWPMTTTLLVCRSLTDFIFFIHILLQVFLVALGNKNWRSFSVFAIRVLSVFIEGCRRAYISWYQSTVRGGQGCDHSEEIADLCNQIKTLTHRFDQLMTWATEFVTNRTPPVPAHRRTVPEGDDASGYATEERSDEDTVSELRGDHVPQPRVSAGRPAGAPPRHLEEDFERGRLPALLRFQNLMEGLRLTTFWIGYVL